MKRIAVIGAGWAGLAAALKLQAQGHHVTIYERAPASAPQHHGAGGRASTAYAAGKKAPFAFDNGQHVLLGAYTQTLALLSDLGVLQPYAFLRLPAAWYVPHPRLSLDISLPTWGDALHPKGVWAQSILKTLPLAVALFKATPALGWHTLAMAALRMHLLKPGPYETVTQWLARLRFPAHLDEQLWLPLCYATLNTPPERASAMVFARVVQDGLLAGSHHAAMLVPRMDLGELLPAIGLQTLAKHGASLCMGVAVQGIEPSPDAVRLHSSKGVQAFDALVCATCAKDAVRLLPANCMCPALHDLAGQTPEPICTIHLNVGSGVMLPRAVCVLPEPQGSQDSQNVPNPIQHAVAIDRQALHPAHAGWITVVLSCSTTALHRSTEELIAASLQRLRECLPTLTWPANCDGLVIHAKQATFACDARLQRPLTQRQDPRVVLAGDYVAGPYPATLEGAVRSGVAASHALQTWFQAS